MPKDSLSTPVDELDINDDIKEAPLRDYEKFARKYGIM